MSHNEVSDNRGSTVPTRIKEQLPIPNKILSADSLLITIAVDARGKDVQDTFLYIADVARFQLIVFDVKNNQAWSVGCNWFYPSPEFGRYNIAGVPFQLMDGLFALTLGPLQKGDRKLYFHALASVREGWVSTSVIRNQSLFKENVDSSWNSFSISGPVRLSQSASEAISESGVLFFLLLSEMELACWNSKKPFTRANIHTVQQDKTKLQFASGMKIINETLWILTDEFQNYVVGSTQANDVKYRILAGSVCDLIRGTGCE